MTASTARLPRTPVEADRQVGLPRSGWQGNLAVDDGDTPIVLQSAGRHGVSDADALHAWAFAVDAYTVDEGMVIYIGPDQAGNLLEVGVVEWHDELAIAHAMPARPRFLR